MEDNFEDAEGEQGIFTDEKGLTWDIPKSYTYETIANYENDNIKAYFELTPEIIEGSTALTPIMYAYEPEERYVNYGGKFKNSVTRMVLNPIEDWSDEERKDVDAFLKYCSDKGGILANEIDAFRFLQAKNFDIKGAYDALVVRKENIDKFMPFTLTERVMYLVHEGSYSICGRDRQFRPIGVIKPKVIFDMDPPPKIEEVLGSCAIVQQYIYDNMLNDGNIESNVMILDMTDQGVFDINYSILKGIMSFTGAVWRGKHRNFFIMNAPKTFDVLFKFA
jgi:hypothetical protein